MYVGGGGLGGVGGGGWEGVSGFLGVVKAGDWTAVTTEAQFVKKEVRQGRGRSYLCGCVA